MGGPATAGCPLNWIEELTQLSVNNSLPLDFISCHAYGGGDDESQVGRVFAVIDGLASTQKAANGKPLVLTEWSSAWSFNIPYHDEPASAPFIVQTLAEMDGLVNVSSYWTFSGRPLTFDY